MTPPTEPVRAFTGPPWARSAVISQAFWVTPALIAIPAALADPEHSWRLHWSPDNEMYIGPSDIEGGESVALEAPADIPAELLVAHRRLRGYVALAVPAPLLPLVPDILRGQIALSSPARYTTGVQTAYVLDALYAGAATSRTFGAHPTGHDTTFALWAPTAQSVTLLTWPPGPGPDQPIPEADRRPMTRETDGSWTLTIDAPPQTPYLYEVVVYSTATGRIEANHVTDPYSLGLTLNSTRSVVLDMAGPDARPPSWEDAPAPPPQRFVDASIYELHIRDFSASDATVPPHHRGSYLAFADDTTGSRHLHQLAEAGLTTVHLLPAFDFASVDEDRTTWAPIPSELNDLPPDGEAQQAWVSAHTADAGYNWGYDPFHWLVPEGSYASSNETAYGAARVAEFRTMVGALHAMGLRVVLDQVYNHTHIAGQDPASVLDRIVPGYYHRREPDGHIYTSAAGANVATEHVMAGKLMVDAVVSWARHYRIDGFRFDLMGFHSREQMLAVRAGLDALTIGADGIDGRTIQLYGEGWDFGEVSGNAVFDQAIQGALGGTRIATFSDRLRDALRGGAAFDSDPRRQGFATGLATDPNDGIADGEEWWQLAGATDLVMLGLAGNLAAYRFRSATGADVTGDQVRYGGLGAGYAVQPDEVVSYVDAHDNETLFDALTLKLPTHIAMTDRVRMNTLALTVVALAQTPCFWHAGADLLRSKSLDRNSYNHTDWFNRLDWSGEDNGSARGLPPAADNAGQWATMRTALADERLRPTASDVAAATACAQDALRLRYSTPLFRLGDAALIQEKVGFPVSGGPDAIAGVIAMLIDDRLGNLSGQDADPTLDAVLVVINATPAEQHQRVPSLRGMPFILSPIQADGADPVVRQSSWLSDEATAVVPARTVAVFIAPSSTS